jgi:hypothetical protein
VRISARSLSAQSVGVWSLGLSATDPKSASTAVRGRALGRAWQVSACRRVAWGWLRAARWCRRRCTTHSRWTGSAGSMQLRDHSLLGEELYFHPQKCGVAEVETNPRVKVRFQEVPTCISVAARSAKQLFPVPLSDPESPQVHWTSVPGAAEESREVRGADTLTSLYGTSKLSRAIDPL